MEKQNLSCRLYEKCLLAYPSDFRQAFGSEMVQVFRDSYREHSKGDGTALVRFWLHTIEDLMRSAFKERTESENSFMNNFKRDVIAVLGSITLIAIAMALLGYGRKHEVSSILFFGYFLDALATTGIVGNLVVFLIAKFTKLNSLRTAFWTFLIVHLLLLAPALLLAGRAPQVNTGSIIVGYIVSFVFWMGIHWMWSRTMSVSTTSVTAS